MEFLAWGLIFKVLFLVGAVMLIVSVVWDRNDNDRMTTLSVIICFGSLVLALSHQILLVMTAR